MTMLADGVWTGHMEGWWWLMLAVPLVLMIVFGAYLTWNQTRGSSDATDILDQRYARGEIDREEYLTRKSDLDQ